MKIVYKIEKLIEAKKVNKTRLAEQIGVSRDTVYNWTDDNIKISTLSKISDALEVPIGYFFGEAGEINTDWKAKSAFYKDLYEKAQRNNDALVYAIERMQVHNTVQHKAKKAHKPLKQ